MKYIESSSTNPYFNLALEEYVFEHMPADDTYFMLWQNVNTIVIGKYQNTLEEINQSYVDENHISVVRRLSGGGAVYHDAGNLNFTFIVNQEDVEDFNFKKFVVPVVNVLKKFGVHAEFNGRNDITIDGKKFSGNSQYGKRGRLLHHGCIMLDSNLSSVAEALRVNEAKFVSKNAKSVRSRVTAINSHTPKPVTMEEFKKELLAEILSDEEIQPYHLTEKDLHIINGIQKEKYETWEWNYGRAKPYSMVREKKFPSGLVSVSMDAENGKIKQIRFFGDFFGNGDIHQLEESLEGIALDEHLADFLKAQNLGYYMNGIDAGELSRLIRG